MIFCLEVRLRRGEHNCSIMINKKVKDSDSETFTKIIKKSENSEVDLTGPIGKFLKNDEVSFLIGKGWKIFDVHFCITKQDLIEYYEEMGPLGGTDHLAADRWPHVSNYMIGNVNTRMLYNTELTPTRWIEGSISGGYVLPKYFKKNQEMWEKVKKSKDGDAIPDLKPSKSVPKPTPKSEPKIKLTKSEGKVCRKEVIEIATGNDVFSGGFKPEFIDSLSDRHQSYMSSLSDLQAKLMRSEVLKKDK